MSPDDDCGAGADAVLYATRLRPQRSLARRGRRRVLTLFAAIQAPLGLALILRGAWPAAFFLALTWAGLALAFARNARAALAYEDLELSAIELYYARVNPAGRRRDWRFNPLWVRLAIEKHEEFGVERLALLSRRTRVEVGAFLGRGEKTRLAEDLSAALARARRGPRFGGPRHD
ncbi:DUF2244 domain-containing protein [Rhodoblastus acidophilus]|uniref:DUF2244 domain-containing protein n=1 Tax=Candidatus Rhodoblastus alkanivorans TaxID=2954117 RepID=A0ABS9Z1X1_9HYPH|nr:DUF2244 domain-containing protein [Candidatus Rhodoblastus alkanivorans]MCI4680482.1 DUF2244 domain-containing protein [Candidatus Rhodoblastus alkanivorans]MCI4681182.1 DUF2244 domain-containing protein [Candidatus Rhodoblastus alkanivorans]MDI4642225.1 DUF2244 domain-containing protein [Rhodoblastus acidophilus]